MNAAPPPLRLNAGLDAKKLAAQFAADQRIQIRDVLDEESAVAITRMLIEQTPWGITWQAGDDGPVGSSRVDLQACKLEYSIVSPK